jgi:hypothetical protein
MFYNKQIILSLKFINLIKYFENISLWDFKIQTQQQSP